MYDAVIRVNQGESRTPEATATAASGTYTITGSPTYTLYLEADDTIVTGHNAQAVTGYDNSALAAVRVWKHLDTKSPTALAVGRYKIVFKFSATKSADSLTDDYVRKSLIIVDAIP